MTAAQVTVEGRGERLHPLKIQKSQENEIHQRPLLRSNGQLLLARQIPYNRRKLIKLSNSRMGEYLMRAASNTWIPKVARSYRMPRNYMDIERLMGYLMCSAVSAQLGEASGEDSNNLEIVPLEVFEAIFQGGESLSVWCAEESLCEHFLETDINPSVFWGFQFPVKSGIIALPSDSKLFLDEDGDRARFLAFSVVEPSRHPFFFMPDGRAAYTRCRDRYDDEYLVEWATFHTESGRSSFSKIGVSRSKGFRQAAELSPEEVGFREKLNLFMLNLFLYLSAYPDNSILALPEECKKTRARSGFASLASCENRYPRWLKLDKSYRAAGVAGGGAHASPRAHWRKGHWRRVGSAETARLTWVRPCLVGASS